MTTLSRYAKSFSALIVGVLGWAGVVVASKPASITSAEWLGLGVVVATALGVYAVPNKEA